MKLPTARALQNIKLEIYYFPDDGMFPNSVLPVIHYVDVLPIKFWRNAKRFEQLFSSNGWHCQWRNTVYDYNHYHSNTHELIGVYKHEAMISLGGEKGASILLKPGDAMLIPAGVAHKNLTPENDLKCVGAYPFPVKFDMNYGKTGERPDTDKRIAQLPIPASDPIYGNAGPLMKHWKL